MTIKQISEALNVDESTIRKRIKKLIPEKIKNGIKTELNEREVTLIKMELESNPHLGRSSEVTTDLEMELMTQKVLLYQRDKINRLQLENEEMKPKAKTYDRLIDSSRFMTIGEIAKTLNIKGVGRNNLYKILREKGIFMSNGSQKNIPYQKFIDAGYFVVKQRLDPYRRRGSYYFWNIKGACFCREIIIGGFLKNGIFNRKI